MLHSTARTSVGFPVPESIYCINIDEAIAECKRWESIRGELDYEIDGMVIKIFSLEGDVTQSGEDIIHIGDPTQMLVRGVAYETPDIRSIAVGQKVEVHLDIDPDRHITGQVQRINRVIDPQTRTFSVYALIDTPESDVHPGLQGQWKSLLAMTPLY